MSREYTVLNNQIIYISDQIHTLYSKPIMDGKVKIFLSLLTLSALFISLFTKKTKTWSRNIYTITKIKIYSESVIYKYSNKKNKILWHDRLLWQTCT